MTHATKLDRALKRAGVPVEGVAPDGQGGWTVFPASLQAAAQPIIDAFDPDDPAHDQTALEDAVTRALDEERLAAAIVWTILKQMFPSDTDAQTKTKFGVARTRIIDAYTGQPWI